MYIVHIIKTYFKILDIKYFSKTNGDNKTKYNILFYFYHTIYYILNSIKYDKIKWVN